MILFGVRSPLVVDVEETLNRLDITVTAAVSINGLPRLTNRRALVDLADFIPPPGSRFFATAFVPGRRRALLAQGVALGMRPCEALIDPTAILPRAVRVGDGSFINAGVVMGALAMMGQGVLVNRAASLGHHCVLGDYVSIGPGAVLAGNVHVGEGALIGAGAVILPDVRIGAQAIVAAGSVVRQHVEADAFVVGNPAFVKPFNRLRGALSIEDSE